MYRLLTTTAAVLCLQHAAWAEGFTYTTPADIAEKDFAGAPDKLADMQARWDATMDAFTKMAIAGNPWGNEYDAPRSNYVDPKVIEPTSNIVQPITWTAFPNKVMWYFSTSQGNPYQIAPELITVLADKGSLELDDVLMDWILAHGEQAPELLENLGDVLQKYPALGQPSIDNFAQLKIPAGAEVCPVVNWESDPTKWAHFSDSVSGPRGWKDEYNEWVVTRNDAGKIVKISFTAENPEYWFSLWEVDPTKVLALYHELVGPQVKIDDLYLRSQTGEPITDENGDFVYNPLNKWNYGNVATADGGGAVHLTSPPNTVGAEMYLGAASTIIRDLPDDKYSPAEMICSGQYGGNFRNSDPNIGMQGNQVTRNLKTRITLTNPIALYMQRPDFSNYVTPDGTDASEFFTIVRGRTAEEANAGYDQILHATFEVPERFGYTVSDIKITPETNTERVFHGAGRKTPPLPILYGSQVAETFNQALAATAYGLPLADSKAYPMVEARDKANGWAQPLVSSDAFWAIQTQPAISAATIPLLPLIAQPGQTLEHMALEVLSGAKDAKITYVDENQDPVSGIEVTVNADKSGPLDSTSAPGKHGVYEIFIYDLTIKIDQSVPPGSYGVQVTNPGNAADIGTPGNLIIQAAN